MICKNTGYFMNIPSFVNRTKETQRIVSEIGNSYNTSNRVIFVAGRIGIGKSRLIKKVIEKDVTGFRTIQPDISKNVAQTISAGAYIDYLEHSIDKLGKEHTYNDIPSKIKYSVRLTTLVKIIISGVLSKIFGQGYYYNKLAKYESIIEKRDYIISVLKKHPYILHIPNVQFIDIESLEILIDISKKVTNTVFIMEYTIDESFDESQLYSLMEHFKTMNGRLSYIIIDKLPFDEVRRITNHSIPSNILREIYNRFNGNIYQLLLCKDDISFNENPIHASISELSQKERFIIHVLYMHNGYWLSNQLCSILTRSNISPIVTVMDYEQAVHSLIESKLIYLNDELELHLAHDSIITEVEKDKLDTVRFIAYNVVKTYYIELLQNNEGTPETHFLFQNMISFADSEIVQYLPTLHKIIRQWKYPDTIISRLSTYREKLLSSVNNQFLFETLSIFLTNLCVDYGSYTEAQKNLELVYNQQNAYHRALKAKTLTLLDNNEEAEEKFKELLHAAKTKREELVIELCKLSRDMAFYKLEISQEKAKNLYKNPQYKSFPEYAFVLRNYAELVDEYDKSLIMYKKAFHMFMKENRMDLAAQVLVSKSMFLAYKGEMKGAYKALDKAVSLKEVRDSHMLNNYAVLDILSGNTTVKTTAYLNDAILLQSDPYEKTITECNLLTAYTILKDRVHAEQTYQQILDGNWKRYQYQEFLHIVYMDLYFYSNTFEESELAEESLASLLKLYNNVSHNSMVANLIKSQIIGDESVEMFYAQFPFRVDFLGDWSIDINPDLEHYE